MLEDVFWNMFWHWSVITRQRRAVARKWLKKAEKAQKPRKRPEIWLNESRSVYGSEWICVDESTKDG